MHRPHTTHIYIYTKRHDTTQRNGKDMQSFGATEKASTIKSFTTYTPYPIYIDR